MSLPPVLLQTPPYACPHVRTCCDPHANMHTCISTHACKFLCIYHHHHHARACPNPRISAHKYMHMRTHTCPIYLRACTSFCLDSLPRHVQPHPLAHPSPQPPSAHTGIGSCKLLDTSENYGNLELALLVQREAQQNKEAVAENEKSLKRESEASGETGRNVGLSSNIHSFINLLAFPSMYAICLVIACPLPARRPPPNCFRTVSFSL